MLTAIWQPIQQREYDWIDDVFGHVLRAHVHDGNHSIVADDCLVIDNFIHRQPASYYRRFANRRNVFLLHLSDEQYHGGYEQYRHFNGVFRNYWSSVFNPASVLTIPLGYSNGLRAKERPAPSSQRRYSWSFAGELGRSSRPDMARALQSIEPHLIHATDGAGARPMPGDEYRALLKDSIFAPCPMGRLNLECFRLYEALECGALPIVERRGTLDYFTSLLGKHPLFTVSGWSEAPDLIRKFSSSTQRLDDKQAEIFDWWGAHKNAVRSAISDHILLANQRKGKIGPQAVAWRRSVPLWQAVELARHHSGRALARRLSFQWNRLLAGGGLIHRPQ